MWLSSAANSETYELGPAGSWLILYMVEYGMLDGEAPASVESAFAYARTAIAKVNPDREPFMVDGIPGDFVLGPWRPFGESVAPSQPAGDGVSPPSQDSSEGEGSGSSRGPVMVCTGVRFGACPER